MKTINQMAIIMLITAVGEVLTYYLPFPIPPGVYGFAILFICLCTKVIKLADVEGIGNFLLSNMQLFLLPLCAELVDFLPLMQERGFLVVVISLVSTAITIMATSKISDIIITKKEKSKV